ncbi:OsmC family protein [Microbacterium sp. A82]|uniref:OsmC family protein n=1 Tax=Microbacterium sp. A82 TaxID=3450452 RepID=UPI003F360B2C
MTLHTYDTALRWHGSTADGYRGYSRGHTATVAPTDAVLALSADPAFRGDATLLNPEQLLVTATSSCQLLSFLAVAAMRGIHVHDYTDTARGFMDDRVSPAAISRIVLQPVITVLRGTDSADVLDAVNAAHAGCYIANSLRSSVELRPTVVVA